jgi:hypothetical protein
LQLHFPEAVEREESAIGLQFKLCLWLTDCLDNMWLETHDHQLVRLIRGLWTGWRSTMAINVFTNIAYSESVKVSLVNSGFKDTTGKGFFLGDDSAMHVSDEDKYSGWLHLSLLERHGYDASPSKQLLDQHRTEFLRVFYLKDRGPVGSLFRAIAGFTSSDLQSEVLRASYSRIAGIVDGFNRLRRRGAHTDIDMFRVMLCEYWGHAVLGDAGDDREIVNPPRALLLAPQWAGGMDVMQFDKLISTKSKVFPRRAMFQGENPEGMEMPEDLKLNLVNEVSTQFQRRFENKVVYKSTQRALSEALRGNGITKHQAYALAQDEQETTARWYKACQEVKEEKTLPKLPSKNSGFAEVILKRGLKAVVNTGILPVVDDPEGVTGTIIGENLEVAPVLSKLAGILKDKEAHVSAETKEVLTRVEAKYGAHTRKQAVAGQATLRMVIPGACADVLNPLLKYANLLLRRKVISKNAFWDTPEGWVSSATHVANAMVKLLWSGDIPMWCV